MQNQRFINRMKEIDATRLKLKCMEMVEGTDLDWWKAIRFNSFIGKHNFDIEPIFSDAKENYELALGIVEGKLVWAGDELYHPNYGKVTLRPNTRTTDYLKIQGMPGLEVLASTCSWNPPTPTTILVELPLETVEFFSVRNSTYFPTDHYGLFYSACRDALDRLNPNIKHKSGD